jgi:hypothetical protein
LKKRLKKEPAQNNVLRREIAGLPAFAASAPHMRHGVVVDDRHRVCRCCGMGRSRRCRCRCDRGRIVVVVMP